MKSWFSSRGSGALRFSSEGAVAAMLCGITIGIVLMLVVWKVVPDVSNAGTQGPPQQRALSGEHTSRGDARHRGSASSTQRTPRDSNAQRLSRCGQMYASQEPPLHAAAAAMSQWQIHIAAMNKLVLGVITLQQANQFWNQTRVGAHARLRAFAASDAILKEQTVRCPTPGDEPAPAALHRCERAVAANSQVLHLARTALATWRLHVRHMDMLRMGMITGAQATQMWLHSWHEGQGQVTRYRDAVQAAGGLRC